jgi:carboxylesterase
MPVMNETSSIELHAGRHAALLLHGLASSPLEVRFVGKLLQRAGFSVFIPAIPGYSSGERCFGWQRWLEEATRIWDGLSSTHASVSVAGLSAGATLALALAAGRPNVQALAAWSPTLFYDGWAIPWYQWLFKPAFHVGIGRRYAYRERPPYGIKNEKWRGRVAHAMLSSDNSAAGPARIPARFLFEFLRLARFTERTLNKITTDTLIMHAADDETASPKNAQVVYAGIKARHKRKILLGDSYHMITMDNERDLVARETIRFFQQSIMQNHPEETFRLVSSARALLRLQRRQAMDRTDREISSA